MLEAQPESDTLHFVKSNLENGNPMMVALPATRSSVGMTFVASSFLRGRTAERSAWACCRNGAAAVSAGVCREATWAQARRSGFKRIELDVHADNPRAISLYERAGFVREGIVRDASLIDGVFRNAILMAIVER